LNTDDTEKAQIVTERILLNWKALHPELLRESKSVEICAFSVQSVFSFASLCADHYLLSSANIQQKQTSNRAM
jgi:hypothetical protein